MGVPGQILGHFKAKERFGNPAIPMKRLFEPTIKLCEEGIRVSRTLALAIKIAERKKVVSIFDHPVIENTHFGLNANHKKVRILVSPG